MDNIEVKQIKKGKNSRNWNKSGIIFFVLPIILTVLFPLGGIFYLCGRFYPHAVSLANLCLLYPLIIGFMVYCFILGIIGLTRYWGKFDNKKRGIIVSQICVPLVFLVLFIASILTTVRGMTICDKPFMYGFRDRMKGKVEVKAIQDWMKTLGKEDFMPEDNIYEMEISREKWPEPLKVLKPGVVTTWLDENDNLKSIILICGGSGFLGHWGVIIETNSTETSPSDSNEFPQYSLLLEPGAYVWFNE